MIVEWSWVEIFRNLDVECQPHSARVMVDSMSSWESDILGKINDSQRNDPELVKVIKRIADRPEFKLTEGVLYCQGRLCVSDV